METSRGVLGSNHATVSPRSVRRAIAHVIFVFCYGVRFSDSSCALISTPFRTEMASPQSVFNDLDVRFRKDNVAVDWQKIGKQKGNKIVYAFLKLETINGSIPTEWVEKSITEFARLWTNAYEAYPKISVEQVVRENISHLRKLNKQQMNLTITKSRAALAAKRNVESCAAMAAEGGPAPSAAAAASMPQVQSCAAVAAEGGPASSVATVASKPQVQSGVAMAPKKGAAAASKQQAQAGAAVASKPPICLKQCESEFMAYA